jgi:hypothetical protein
MGLEKAGEKLFTETGNVKFEGDLQEGVPKSVSYTSRVTGEDNKFPDGEEKDGRGTITLHANSIVLASYTGSLDGKSLTSHETSKLVDGGKKVQGEERVRVTGFDTPIIMKTEMDLSPPNKGKFNNTGYELK